MRYAFPLYASQAGGIGGVHSAGLESGGIAAVEGDGEAQFVPGGTIHLGGDNAEIEADVEQDGADRAVAVLLYDLREDFLLGGGLAVEGVITGRPARWDGPSGGVRLAWGWPGRPVGPRRGSVLVHGEGREGDALAEPCPEGGEAEQAAEDGDGDQRGIGGAEDFREEGVPGRSSGSSSWRSVSTRFLP